MGYFTDVYRQPGPLRFKDEHGHMFGVLESPTNHQPIGTATCVGWDAGGLALFRLTVGGRTLPGNYHAIAGEFVPTDNPQTCSTSVSARNGSSGEGETKGSIQ